MTREEISLINPNAIVWDGLDEAIIGMASKEEGKDIVITDANNVVIDVTIEKYDDEDEYVIDRWERESFGPIVAYDIHKIVEVLSKDMEVEDSTPEEIEMMKYEMAYEFFEFNILGGFVGEFTPIHLNIEN